jgi:hypothetical protein
LLGVHLKGLEFIGVLISTHVNFSFTFNAADFSIVLTSYDYIISVIIISLPLVLLRLYAVAFPFTWVTQLPLGMIMSVKFWQLGDVERK